MASEAITKAGRQPLAAILADWFPWLLVAYFALQTLRRLAEAPNLNLDEAELMIPTQAFAWGYGSQPPLYAWLQMVVFDIFGRSLFSLALLKNLLLFGAFWLIYQTALRIYADRLKAMTVAVSVFLLPQVGWEDQLAFWQSVVVCFAAAATLCVFVGLLGERRLAGYLLFGVTIAVGILSKYTYLLLLVGLVAAALAVPSGRRVLFDWRLIGVSLPAAVLLILPTGLWSLSDQSLLLARTAKFAIGAGSSPWSAALSGMAALAVAVVGSSAICVAAYAAVAFFSAHGEVDGTGDHANPDAWHRDVRVIVVLTPVVAIAVALVLVLASGTTLFAEAWLQPALLGIPLACFMVLERRLGRSRQVLLSVIGIAVALAAVVALWVNYRFPDVVARPYTAAPFDVLARRIEADGFSHGTIVASSSYVAGNLKFRLPAAQTLTGEYSALPLTYSPPFLIAWDGELDPKKREFLEASFRAVCDAPLPADLAAKTLSAPYWGSAKRIFTLDVAILARCPSTGSQP